jgi:Adenylate cyclase associated (CAP) N terminal
MFSASGINLTTLIKRFASWRSLLTRRLEAATSRLEEIAVANTNDFKEAQAAQRGSTASSLSKETTPQFNMSMFGGDSSRRGTLEDSPLEEKSPVILDYERLITNFVDPWVTKSERIGQVVGEQVKFWDLVVLIKGSGSSTTLSNTRGIHSNRFEVTAALFSTGTLDLTIELT